MVGLGGKAFQESRGVWGAACPPMSGLGVFLLTSNFGRHRFFVCFLIVNFPEYFLIVFCKFFVGSAGTVRSDVPVLSGTRFWFFWSRSSPQIRAVTLRYSSV